MKALLSWLRAVEPHTRYLAAAADLADLERRLRLLERGSPAPLFVTFNH